MADSHASPLPGGSYTATREAPAGQWASGRPRRPAARQWQANTASILGASLCLLAGLALLAGAPLIVAAVLFPLGGLGDLIDGRLARAAAGERPPPLGAFIDSVCDKVGEVGLLLGIAFYVHDDPAILVLAIAAFGFGWFTSYTKPVAAELGLAMVWPEARVFGRAGRVVLLSTTLLVASLVPEAREAVLAVGLTFLLVFSCATFTWRLSRITRALVARRELH